MNETDTIIRVLIVDDSSLMRVGIRFALEQVPDIQVVGEAQDGEEAKQMVARLRPDILLLDLIMPGPRSSEVEVWIRKHYPETITLVLTGHNQDSYLVEMIKAGVAGYISKSEAAEKLVDAIRRAMRGEIILTGEQWSRVRCWEKTVDERWQSLTRRERLVLRLIADSQSNKQIAVTLNISERTVETHIGNLLNKLGVASRLKAAMWFWQHDLGAKTEFSGGNQPEKDG